MAPVQEQEPGPTQTDATDDQPIFGVRRGWTLRDRFRAKESYGLLLAMIVLSLVAAATSERFWGGSGLAVTLQGGVLLFALWTSRSGRWALRLALVLVPVMVVASAAVSESTADDAAAAIALTSAVLAFAAIAAIARRLAQHPRVDSATILGALSIYLLLGTTFAAVYKLTGAVSSDPFFVNGPAQGIDYLYFSFVTLTTTGYGDLTAAGDVGRMLAVTEALLGQLYLVSVVAFVIGNVGRGRRPKP
jgi:hypothetical protein